MIFNSCKYVQYKQNIFGLDPSFSCNMIVRFVNNYLNIMGSFFSWMWNNWIWPSWLWHKKNNQKKRTSEQKDKKQGKEKENLLMNNSEQGFKVKKVQTNIPIKNKIDTFNISPTKNDQNSFLQQVKEKQPFKFQRKQKQVSKDTNIYQAVSIVTNKISKTQGNNPIQQKNTQFMNRSYQLTNEDAKRLSKQGFEQGQPRYTVEECRLEMGKQLHKLNTQYKYSFAFKEEPYIIHRAKKMTRTIYLSFQCEDCNSNRWTSIGGTFQITFQYNSRDNQLIYHLEIYKTQCRICKQLRAPKAYKIQMEAMKIFFSAIITNILEKRPPPQKPQRYNIREIHGHQQQLCEACHLGRCTTQNRK